MKQIYIVFLCFTLIKLAYCDNNECVKRRKWQIGYTMYENIWYKGRLYVYSRCNSSSHSLSGENWTPCLNGLLNEGLPQCYPKEGEGGTLDQVEVEDEFFRCEVGNQWQDGITKYEVNRSDQGLYVSAKCIKEDFIIDRSDISCVNFISKRYLPQCRIGEVKNSFQACATGRRSRNEDYEFENVWQFNSLYVKVFCLHEGTETRSDTILCENGKMKRTPAKNICERLVDLPSIAILPESKEVSTTNGSSSPTKDESIGLFDRNKCRFENGGCNHICKNENGRALCSCGEGYQLQKDSKTCVGKSNENLCVFGKKWTANNTEYEIFGSKKNLMVVSKCRKPSGFHIPSSGWKLCEKGTIPLELPKCRDINECLFSNFGCSDKCINTIGSAFCSCRLGYQLQEDQKTCSVVNSPTRKLSSVKKVGAHITNRNSSHDTVVNSPTRAISPVRKVGAHITNRNSSHPAVVNSPTRTISPARKVGAHIRNRNSSHPVDISSRPSKKKCAFENGGCNQICKTKNGTIQCSCNEGYELQPDNKTCVDINECLSNNYGCSDKCINAGGSAYCSCRDGFTLQSDGKHCTDIDECANKATHKCEQQCHNTNGSYKCSCLPGHVLINDFRCEGCRKNSYRSSLDTFCVDCPLNSHTESDSKSSIGDCICNSGFYGNISNDERCRDIDESASSNFGCSDSCINTIGSAFCSCPVGYQLQKDQKTCIDIDECQVKNGGCQGICHNFDGSFRCTCEDGYTVSTIDSYACDDINECLENNGGCSGECVNFLGGYQCSCPEDSFIAEDKKTCLKTLYCPEVPIPHHSRLICFPKANKDAKSKYFSKNATYSEKLPVGTVCLVKCNKGYAIEESSSTISCQKNGIWNDTLEECKVSQCPRLKPPANGDVHPPECKEGLMTVKEKCYFTCNEGYSIKGNITVFTCQNKLLWSYDEVPQCEPNSQSPEILDCPATIRAIGSNVGGAVVDWEEPTAFDNVGIKSVLKSAEQNSTWFPGLHIVEYIAEDFAGNIASCSFEINVTSNECEDLKDPENGYANCQDWGYGKVCEPTCHTNYTRRYYNEDELYYFCDDNGMWTPSDVISPCLPECESEKIWSPELEKCVDITDTTTDTLSV